MKHSNWFGYQFYYGRAFEDGDWDYSERYEAIFEELMSAKDQILKGEQVSLDVEVLARLREQIEVALQRESALYKALNIATPVVSGDEHFNAQFFIKEMDKIRKKLQQSFNNPDRLKASFLAILNNKDFLTQVAGKTTTLSFTTYGGIPDNNVASREKGKKELVTALNKGLNKSGSLNKNYAEIKKVLQKSFGEDFESKLQEMGEDLNEIIGSAIVSFYTKKDGSRYVWTTKNAEARQRRMMKSGVQSDLEQKIKKFYKDLHRTIKSRIQDGGYANTYMDGALFLYDEFSESPYAQGIILKIYNSPSGNPDDIFSGKGQKKQRYSKTKLIQLLYDFFVKEIGFFGQNQDWADVAQKALQYLTGRGKKEFKLVLEEAFDKRTGTDLASAMANFSSSQISGFWGEIAGLFYLHNGKKGFKPLFLSDNLNELGQKSNVDIQLKIYNNGKYTVLGVQVKNYTSSNSVTLYGSETFQLSNSNMSRYLKTDDLKLFRFMVANSYMGTEMGFDEYEKNSLELILYNYIDNFLRVGDEKSNMNFTNDFFVINNNLYPVSELLARIYLECEEILEDASQIKLFELVGIPSKDDIVTVDGEKKYESFLTIPSDQQQPATKIIKDTEYTNALALSIIDEQGFFPRKVIDAIGKTRIKFHGITVTI